MCSSEILDKCHFCCIGGGNFQCNKSKGALYRYPKVMAKHSLDGHLVSL